MPKNNHRITLFALMLLLALVCMAGSAIMVGDMLRIAIAGDEIPINRALIALFLAFVAFCVMCLLPEKLTQRDSR